MWHKGHGAMSKSQQGTKYAMLQRFSEWKTEYTRKKDSIQIGSRNE